MAKAKNNFTDDRATEAELKKSYHLDIKNIDQFIDLLHGNYKAPPLPGEDIDKIAKPIDDNYLSVGSEMATKKRILTSEFEEEENVEDEGYEGDEGEPETRRHVQSNAKVKKYEQITKHLERFAFSSNTDEKESQMSEIEETLRGKLNEMTIKQVAQNTKNAFAKYANKFSLVPGGIKVGFSFGEKDLNVVAKGNFYGDEIIAVDTKENKIIPKVLKINNNKKQDLSKNFEINIVK